MADPAQIEQELRDYLEKEPNLRRSDRLPYLMTIIKKHFELDKVDHMMNYDDFSQMLSHAKSSFAQTTLPMYVTRKQVEGVEINYVLMLEAFTSYLSRNKLLKRLVKIDYRR